MAQVTLIEEEGLRVRPLREADVGAMARWLSDPHVLEWYEGRDRPFSEKEVRAEFLLGKDDRLTACLVLYEERPIAYVQFYPWEDPAEGEGVWGMDQFIGEPELWNRGLGSRLVRTVAGYLIRERGAKRVLMDPQARNRRAIQAYEKAGFRKVRLLERHELHEGVMEDCWLMEYRAEPSESGSGPIS